MKRFFCFILVLLFAHSLFVSCICVSDNQFCMDEQNLISSDQKLQLESIGESLKSKHQVLLLVVTKNIPPSSDPEEYASSVYHDVIENHFSQDSTAKGGAVFLVDSVSRCWSVVYFGSISDLFRNEQLDSLEEKIYAHLSNDQYFDAFNSYYSFSESVIIQHSDELIPSSDFSVELLISSLFFGAIIALIVVLCLISQLKNASRYTAFNYVKPGSFHLTHSKDLFLYRTVTRRAKESKHSTSSGRSSGRSGRF